MARKDLLCNLTDEQKKKANAYKSMDELLALAQKEGYELNDEQLEAVSGGCGNDNDDKDDNNKNDKNPNVNPF
jgi:hypothetical protein